MMEKMRLFVWVLGVTLAIVCGAEDYDNDLVEVQDGYHQNAEVQQSQESFLKNKEVFIPTKNWQEVKPGQGIPPGLHVRMNMETGKTEAKLLDENESKDASDDSALVSVERNEDEDEEEVTIEDESDPEDKARLSRMQAAMEEAMKELKEGEEGGYKYWKSGDKEGIMNTDKKSFTKEELKEALKKFKTEREQPQMSEEDIRKKFRPMDELKKDLEEMELSIKTEVEILESLLEKYRKPGLGTEDKVTILTDLEYYVHQIDNAQVFTDIGGMEMVVRDLNSTSEQVRSEAAFVVGSATQSNPKVQISALEYGALQTLTRMLSTEATSGVKKRVLYAVSSMLRNFPFAQKSFIQHGGLQALLTLFQEDGTEQLRLKAITLLTDLLLEKNHVHSSGNEEKIKQYDEVLLLETMLEQGWCGHIPGLLSMPDHDYREKILNAMILMNEHCHKPFTNAKSTLQNLRQEYEKLAQEEIAEGEDDVYFSTLLKHVNTVYNSLTKDEL